MNLFQLFLFLHLTGALVLLLLILASFILIFKNKLPLLKNLSLGIGFGTLFQLTTGTLLSLVSANGQSLIVFCSRIGIYLTIVLVTEMVIFLKIKNIFPLRQVASYILTGVIISLIPLGFGALCQMLG